MNATGECSGAETVLLSLLAMAIERGAEVVVLAPPGPLGDRLPSGATHVTIATLMPPSAGAGIAGRGHALASMLGGWRTSRATIALNVQHPGTHTVVNSLWALPVVRAARPARPVTWLVHDTVHTRRQRALVRAGSCPLGRRPIVRAVAVSEATAAPLRALGLDVTVRPNGVAWPVPAVDVSRLHEPPVVGALALLTPWKGQRVLLDTIARLRGVRVQLAGGHFAGDAAYVAALHERAAQADLAGRVDFLGPVDALTTLATWDVFVSASTSPEAGPLGVLEAMSVGLPVVVSSLGGSPEYVGDGGLVVPPSDPVALSGAIDSLLADAPARRRLGERARARVAAHYDAASTRQQLFDAVMQS